MRQFKDKGHISYPQEKPQSTSTGGEGQGGQYGYITLRGGGGGACQTWIIYIYIYMYISVIFPKISGKYDGFSTIPLLFVIQILDPGEWRFWYMRMLEGNEHEIQKSVSNRWDWFGSAWNCLVLYQTFWTCNMQEYELACFKPTLRKLPNETLNETNGGTACNQVTMKNALSGHWEGTKARGQSLKPHIQSPLLRLDLPWPLLSNGLWYDLIKHIKGLQYLWLNSFDGWSNMMRHK